MVKRCIIAFNINAFHKDAFAARQHKFHIQRLIAVVAGDLGFDPQEIKPLAQGQTFHPGDVVFNHGGRITDPRAQFLHSLKLSRVNPFNRGRGADLTHCKALPFADVEGHKRGVPFPRHFGRGVGNLKIDIAARQIEIAQKLFVQLHPFGDKRVALDQLAQQPRLLGFQNLPQTAVGIGAVADKRQAFHFDNLAFGDLEHQIDAVV